MAGASRNRAPEPARGFDGFRKRSDVVVPFRTEKIERAVQHAVDNVSRNLEIPLAQDIAPLVAQLLGFSLEY